MGELPFDVEDARGEIDPLFLFWCKKCCPRGILGGDGDPDIKGELWITDCGCDCDCENRDVCGGGVSAVMVDEECE